MTSEVTRVRCYQPIFSFHFVLSEWGLAWAMHLFEKAMALCQERARPHIRMLLFKASCEKAGVPISEMSFQSCQPRDLVAEMP